MSVSLGMSTGTLGSDRSAARAAAVSGERERLRRDARRGKLRGWLTTLLVSIAMLVIWEVAADLWLSDRGVIAAPSAIIESLISDSDLYWRNFTATAWIAVRGWFIGNVLAILVAIVFVQFPAFESIFLRLALTIFCLPLVAVNPILQLTFTPDTAKVTLAALAVFFTTLVGTMLGLRSADGGPLTMVTAWGGGSLSKLALIRIPSGIPAIITGLQIGAAAAALGAIFSEFIGAKTGLGVLLINGLMSLDLARVWSVAVLVTALAAIPYALLGALRRWVAPWSSTISTAPAQPRAPHSLLRRTVTGVVFTVASLVVIVFAWWAYLKVFDLSPFVGKGPQDVYEFLFDSPEAADNRSELIGALGTTLLHAGVGYIAGLVIGVLMAVAFVTFPVVARVLTPLAVALRSVPIIVLIPLLILALGRDLPGVVAITAIVTFFPTLANTQTALGQVPADAAVLMRSYDSSVWTSLWRLQLPYALPSLFASARIAAPTAILAATLAEWLATGDGLGHTIVSARAHSEYTQLWAAAAVLTVVSLIFYAIVTWAERAVLRRYAPAQLS